jgi:hypothetical protein
VENKLILILRKREEAIYEGLTSVYNLIWEYEKIILLTKDPMEVVYYSRQIQRYRKQARQYKRELKILWAEITSLESLSKERQEGSIEHYEG